MNQEMLKQMREGKGFIAALDQSGGSTPKALRLYGITEDRYQNEDEMFALIHDMRKRIMKAAAFTGERIIGAILFEITMKSDVDGKPTPDFLWEDRHIVPFLKIDVGLEETRHGVRLMKPIPNFRERLQDALKRHIFGTKMRSVIESFDEDGIRDVVEQQFDFARTIAGQGLVPIIEPEISIAMEHKAEAEVYLKECLLEELSKWPKGLPVMFKLTLPEAPDLYRELYDHEAVVRIVALSGGYSREEANDRLSKNHGMIASFSRALTEGLTESMSDEVFDREMGKSIESIYRAGLS